MWEYKVFEGDSLPNEQNLNELSEQGWELIQIIDRGGYVYVYLRRKRS